MDSVLCNGICVGGPFDGYEMTCRFPKGFLAVDRPNERCWLYDFDNETSSFVVRDADGIGLVSDPEQPKNRYRAADEPEFDVLAVP